MGRWWSFTTWFRRLVSRSFLFLFPHLVLTPLSVFFDDAVNNALGSTVIGPSVNTFLFCILGSKVEKLSEALTFVQLFSVSSFLAVQRRNQANDLSFVCFLHLPPIAGSTTTLSSLSQPSTRTSSPSRTARCKVSFRPSRALLLEEDRVILEMWEWCRG